MWCDGSYFNTWATVFGPNHDPTGFPSETPIEAVKKGIMLNNDYKYMYMNVVTTYLIRHLCLWPSNLTMTDISKICPLLQRGAYKTLARCDTCNYTNKNTLYAYLPWYLYNSIKIRNSSQFLTPCKYLFAVWSSFHSFCLQTFVEFSYRSGLDNSYSTSSLQ